MNKKLAFIFVTILTLTSCNKDKNSDKESSITDSTQEIISSNNMSSIENSSQSSSSFEISNENYKQYEEMFEENIKPFLKQEQVYFTNFFNENDNMGLKINSTLDSLFYVNLEDFYDTSAMENIIAKLMDNTTYKGSTDILSNINISSLKQLYSIISKENPDVDNIKEVLENDDSKIYGKVVAQMFDKDANVKYSLDYQVLQSLKERTIDDGKTITTSSMDIDKIASSIQSLAKYFCTIINIDTSIIQKYYNFFVEFLFDHIHTCEEFFQIIEKIITNYLKEFIDKNIGDYKFSVSDETRKYLKSLLDYFLGFSWSEAFSFDFKYDNTKKAEFNAYLHLKKVASYLSKTANFGLLTLSKVTNQEEKSQIQKILLAIKAIVNSIVITNDEFTINVIMENEYSLNGKLIVDFNGKVLKSLLNTIFKITDSSTTANKNLEFNFQINYDFSLDISSNKFEIDNLIAIK